jgi:hypothetical protein
MAMTMNPQVQAALKTQKHTIGRILDELHSLDRQLAHVDDGEGNHAAFELYDKAITCLDDLLILANK